MLYEIFKDLQGKLSDIVGVKLVDWFNNQYDGTILQSPVIYIEFPEALTLSQQSQLYQTSDTVVRIHVVSKILSGVDGRIYDDALTGHEFICTAVYERLHGQSDSNETNGRYSHLCRTKYQHWHHNKGWMLTTQDFETIAYVYPESEITSAEFGEFVISAL